MRGDGWDWLRDLIAWALLLTSAVSTVVYLANKYL